MALKKYVYFLVIGVFLLTLSNCYHYTTDTIVEKREKLFSEDIILVPFTDTHTHLMGYKDRTNNISISARFDYAANFELNVPLALVSERGKYGLINPEGDIVIPLSFDTFEHRKKDGMLILLKDQKKYQIVETEHDFKTHPLELHYGVGRYTKSWVTYRTREIVDSSS